jgi:hypothetical protein
VVISAAARIETEKLGSVRSAGASQRELRLEHAGANTAAGRFCLGGARGRNNDEAVRLMRSAAELEDATEKNPVTPGAVLPARELLEIFSWNSTSGREHCPNLKLHSAIRQSGSVRHTVLHARPSCRATEKRRKSVTRNDRALRRYRFCQAGTAKCEGIPAALRSRLAGEGAVRSCPTMIVKVVNLAAGRSRQVLIPTSRVVTSSTGLISWTAVEINHRSATSQLYAATLQWSDGLRCGYSLTPTLCCPERGF